jgi:hypothetical protein
VPETAGRAWRNNTAILADTSSAPAATTLVVGNAAAALASLIVEPIFAKSVAAEDTNSGATLMNDITGPFHPHSRR